MSDKRMNEIGRRQRFRRRLRGEKKAVSPVVATLILILIAVAAAAALYLWLVAWQGGVTSTVGSPTPQYTVTIGGSTSVYPFAEQAATWFDANNSDVAISVNQGGSGAGMAAVCSGQVDIGEASTFYGSGAQPAASPGSIETQYGCPSTIAVEVIAYDGVDAIVSNTNSHALNNITWDTLQAVYFNGATLLPGDTGYVSGQNIYAQGSYHMDGVVSPIQPAQGTGYAWDQIPACAAAAMLGCNGANNLGIGNLYSVATPAATAATPSTATAVASGANTITGTATFTLPSGDTFADGANIALTWSTTGGNTAPSTNPAATITSASQSGTTLTLGYTFSASWGAAGTAAVTGAALGPIATDWYLLGSAATTPFTTTAMGTTSTGTYCSGTSGDYCTTGGATPVSTCGFTVCPSGTNAIDLYSRSDVSGTQQSFESRLLAIGATGGTPQGIGFTGCPNGDNMWDVCNVAMPSKYAENGNPAVIAGVAGDANGIGFASDGLAQASGTVTPISFQGYGQSVVVKIVGESVALSAIAKGIADHESAASTYATDQAYVGWRPFLNVETAPPTGEVLRYLQWVMDPANNQALAAATYEISVYASGLAGHVPVTPIP